MTPDQDLSARLCPRCGKPLIDPMAGITFGGKEHITCPPPEGWPEREQTITLADHERAVQAAVAKEVEAERDACAEILDNEAADYEADAERYRGGSDPHHYRRNKADAARKYAAAIRSRGVAG